MFDKIMILKVKILGFCLVPYFSKKQVIIKGNIFKDFPLVMEYFNLVIMALKKSPFFIRFLDGEEHCH